MFPFKEIRHAATIGFLRLGRPRPERHKLSGRTVAQAPLAGSDPYVQIPLTAGATRLDRFGVSPISARRSDRRPAPSYRGCPVIRAALLLLRREQPRCAAVLEAWYPGEQDGNAVAAILFGDVNPSGRLPQTFPPSTAAVPASSGDQWPGSGDGQDAAFTEGLDVGYRWYDAHKVTPLFPFGYGLSYTSFAYSHMRITRSDAHLAVSFTVRNTGARAGAEVAQLYVDDPAAAGEPPKQLQEYQRVYFRSGRSARLTIALTRRSFSVWDTASQSWRTTPGLYRILVGASSRDIRLRGFVRK